MIRLLYDLRTVSQHLLVKKEITNCCDIQDLAQFESWERNWQELKPSKDRCAYG